MPIKPATFKKMPAVSNAEIVIEIKHLVLNMDKLAQGQEDMRDALKTLVRLEAEHQDDRKRMGDMGNLINATASTITALEKIVSSHERTLDIHKWGLRLFCGGALSAIIAYAFK
mgnify:CR=1 FL=1